MLSVLDLNWGQNVGYGREIFFFIARASAREAPQATVNPAGLDNVHRENAISRKFRPLAKSRDLAVLSVITRDHRGAACVRADKARKRVLSCFYQNVTLPGRKKITKKIS